MTAIAPTHDSDCGTICIQCGDALIAPEWSEYVNERLVLNLWSCSKCGYRFETEAHMPADAKSAIDAMTIEAFFPSLLVA
jgi:ribosomal protein L37AE/L43A